MRSLVWFRSDLRVRDNLALMAACQSAAGGPDGGVVAVFAICPDQWREHDWGHPKVDFVMRNLVELRDALADRNIPLKILSFPRFDSASEKLLALARETRCHGLFFNQEFEINERKRDAEVTEAFVEAGLSVRSSVDKVFYEPGSILTKQDKWYTVYTPFKKAWWARFKDGDAPTPDGLAPKQPEIDITADDVPAGVDGFHIGKTDEQLGVRPDLWQAGEDHALSRLGSFIRDRVGEYAQLRDYPAVNATSTMSPYLTMGVVSPRQCFRAALDANQNKIDSGSRGITKWMEELIWREFYHHLLIGFPKLCKNRAFRPELDAVEWRDDDEGFARWCRGDTGYPMVDAGMRQLNRTGWMHNRPRMVVAMFLTKHLLIDWRKGERYFMQRLVDGDLASNNGGWQWSASTGTDAQPYFRIYNPTMQGERFDEDGEYIKRFVPELSDLDGKAAHDPSSAEMFEELHYCAPMVEHKMARERALGVFKAAAKG
jgi:deoxyribodipyrimidine photo-lyase